jgi:hypothetical protein
MKFLISQKANCIFSTKNKQLMLFGKIVTVYFEKHTKHTDTLCGQNAEFLDVTAGSTYSEQLM